ncbi:Uncharacterised protein [BD1-7 clade bacterium]|nr:Uncharacterised protein [BD1-7 clade bacterium]
MKAVAQLSEQERKELFTETANAMGVTAAAAEKDFWICWVLLHVFEHAPFNQYLRFKGGTSLSKCYGAIARFSEDIDLILDWTQLTQVNLVDARSKTQQDKLNQSINAQAKVFIAESLLPELTVLMGDTCSLSVDADDPHTINIVYPKAFESAYLRPQVRLEIGPLAAMLPMAQCGVKPYAAEYFPVVFDQPQVVVPTITAVRTFWEKLTILHAEAHRPPDKALPARYARHYYDVFKLIVCGVAGEALAATDLLAEVVAFKQRFYPSAWANYDGATLASLALLPSDHHRDALRVDYANMQEMLFGEKPDFDEMMKTLMVLEGDVHSLAADQ